MLLLLQIVGLIFMVTLIFIIIWGFVLANQVFGQLRYRNYLLEKLCQHVYMLSKKNEDEK